MSIKLRLLVFCLYIINTTVANLNDGEIKVDDMIMSQSQYSTPVNPGQNSGRKDLKFRWPNGVVPYKIENQFNDQDKASINAAIMSLNQELNGCINIRPASGSDVNYINFIDGSDCSSKVGYVGGKQDISLKSNGCIYRSTIKHEIYHSLGYYHEQSRPDRDNFVTINLANVKIIQGINMSYNFEWKQNTETFGVPYDGRSNMHYGYKAFSKNGLPTIEAKPSLGIASSELGSANNPTTLDLEKIKRMYSCNKVFSVDLFGKHDYVNCGAGQDIQIKLTSTNKNCTVKVKPELKHGNVLTWKDTDLEDCAYFDADESSKVLIQTLSNTVNFCPLMVAIQLSDKSYTSYRSEMEDKVYSYNTNDFGHSLVKVWPTASLTATSELTHGPFGAGPTINGRRVVGSPFTAIGPFAKISIKAMLFVQGIKTESKDGTVQTFGTFDEYDTFIVRESIVPQGEHISGVEISLSQEPVWFIDQLGFVTNTNRHLGDLHSSIRSETVPRNIDSGRTLISIEGELVNYKGSAACSEIITRLKFTFAELNQSGGGQNGGGQRRGGQNGGGQNRGENGNGNQYYNNY